jgi:hypothetical protein
MLNVSNVRRLDEMSMRMFSQTPRVAEIFLTLQKDKQDWKSQKVLRATHSRSSESTTT